MGKEGRRCGLGGGGGWARKKKREKEKENKLPVQQVAGHLELFLENSSYSLDYTRIIHIWD